MPRFKTAPLKNRSFCITMEHSDLDESALDDEEVRRLEEELNILRHEKANQIRKMRYKREEAGKLYNNSPYNSSEFDTTQCSDEEELENSSIKARQSTRDLADGFEKAQQRFMFNIHSIEEKYKRREQSDIPESKVEVDCHGNFFFPENMSGSRQQAFVNRMYQNDALFGKGSVSAPRNSIQSFEGDNRALAKSLQLDKKFGRELKTAEFPFDERKEERTFSYVSGIPMRANFSPSSSSRLTLRYSEDLDDDVFETFSENLRPHEGFMNSVERKNKTVARVESEQPIDTFDVESKKILANVEKNKTSKRKSSTDGHEEAVMALSERPNRTKKPTEKIVAMTEAKRTHNHEHSTEGSPPDSGKCDTNVNKRNSGNNPFCKHCEFVREEKRKSKANAILLKNSIDSQKATTSTIVDTQSKASNSQSVSSIEGLDKKSLAKKMKMPKKPTSSHALQVKRRSGIEASEEPEKKKQKLIDSDLLSIPSSMAIIVDTELIAAENPSLSSSRIPQFSENSSSSSVWSTTVDVEWIKDVKKVQGEMKSRRFFGVPVTEYPKDIPVINFWVDNLLREDSRKDPFTTDYRRILAQDKKARIDVKAGYNVPFSSR